MARYQLCIIIIIIKMDIVPAVPALQLATTGYIYVTIFVQVFL